MPAFKSRKKPMKEPHAAREPRGLATPELEASIPPSLTLLIVLIKEQKHSITCKSHRSSGCESTFSN